KGGDVVNIMGGATINLMRADLKGPATLEVVQLFGGTTIITPSHWIIQPQMASIFGGIEDKRFHTHSAPDRTKVLYIKGTSIFGGITIKSILYIMSPSSPIIRHKSLLLSCAIIFFGWSIVQSITIFWY